MRSPLALLLCIALHAVAGPPMEQMMRSTVQFRLAAYNAAGRRLLSWGGSGYVIADRRHVVTNYHVCCDPDPPDEWPTHIPYNEAARTIEVAIEKDQWVPATAVWSSAAKDLGIVRLKSDSGRPPVAFAPRRLVSEGMHVWALGFPGASDSMTDEEGRHKVKVSDGVVSAVTRTRTQRRILAGARVYQTNLSTNPGNSGGPVFDDCGRVIATHSHSTRADGVKWEVQADELLEELPKLGITVTVTGSKCVIEGGSGGGGGGRDYLLLGGQAATALLALTAIVLASTRRGREYVKKVTTSYRHGGPGPAPAKGKPVLKGLSGFYSGTVLELGSETFTLGRDARTSNLVYPPDAGVSRRHCSVHFDIALNRFVLEDTWSTNGTFLENGEPVTPGQPHELKPGDRFYLGNRENTFEVGIEGVR